MHVYTDPLAIAALDLVKNEQEALGLWRALLNVKNADAALVKALPWSARALDEATSAESSGDRS